MSDFGRRLGIILYMEHQIAYAELLRRHRATVWRMCWLKARGDWERCRDLVQEVSVALWMHFEELRPGVTPAEERAWVRWVTRSALDHQTRKRRVETMPLTPMHEESIAAEDRQAQREDIDDMMASLSHDEQRIMRLRMEGFRANEIASIMGLSNDAVYQRIHRIAVKLRRLLGVLLLLVFTTTLAIAVVPQWRKTVVEKVRHSQKKEPPQKRTPTDEPKSSTEPSADTVQAVHAPQAAPAEVEPAPSAEVPTQQPRQKYDFLYFGATGDTLACFLSDDGRGVAVSCIAAGARVIVPETLERDGHSYAVTALADSAFFSLSSIRSVRLPASLASVGRDAFSLCAGIDTLEVLATEPPVVAGEWCFFGMADTVRLLVPCGTSSAYRNAPQWDGFEYVVDPCEPQHVPLPEVTIIVKGNTIVVEGADDEPVEVYDAQGRLVATAQCKGRCSLPINTDHIGDRTFSKSATGSFWVKVGSRPLRRVSLGAKHIPASNNIFINYRDLDLSF